MVHVTLDAFSWSIIEYKVDPESTLAQKLDIYLYGADSDEAITIPLNLQELELFNAIPVTDRLLKIFNKE